MARWGRIDAVLPRGPGWPLECVWDDVAGVLQRTPRCFALSRAVHAMCLPAPLGGCGAVPAPASLPAGLCVPGRMPNTPQLILRSDALVARPACVHSCMRQKRPSCSSSVAPCACMQFVFYCCMCRPSHQSPQRRRAGCLWLPRACMCVFRCHAACIRTPHVYSSLQQASMHVHGASRHGRAAARRVALSLCCNIVLLREQLLRQLLRAASY